MSLSSIFLFFPQHSVFVFVRTVNELIAPSGTQNAAIVDIVDELYPHNADESSSYYYFHAKNDENITDIDCIKQAELNMQQYINDYEDEHNVTILRHDAVGTYVSNSTELQAMFTKQHGTIVLFELSEKSKELYADFNLFEDIVNEAVDDACSQDDKDRLKYGHIGLAKFLVDVRVSLITF